LLKNNGVRLNVDSSRRALFSPFSGTLVFSRASLVLGLCGKIANFNFGRLSSKWRMPPPYMRRPAPGPGMVHPESFGPGMHPPPGGFPFDMLPQVLEQKIAAQDMEMERLLTENRRLAATHGTLRQQLASVEQEKQSVEARVGAMKSEREQEMRALKEKISKMEAELKAADSIKTELQKAHTEAQGLVKSRQELLSKAQKLNQDLQKAHVELAQLPALMSQLDGLRQEYHHCRAVYESEKKLYNDHLESLQSMEKNYNTMAQEVEKLRSELNNTASADKRSASAYAGAVGYGMNSASSLVKNAYEDGYGDLQGHALPTNIAPGSGIPPASGAPTSFGGHQLAAQVSSRPSYDFQRGPTYEAPRAPYYDTQGGSAYNVQRYEPQMGPSFAMYDPQRAGPPARPPPQSQMGYGSAGPPARPVAGYEPQPRGGNTGRR
ncbi:hypothetical protein V2J09_010849, partial [Rumex salicifolius]